MKKTTTLQTGKPVLPPVGLRLFEERLPAKEIARRVDKRPLGELESQVGDALKQILVRVHAGDDDALLSFFQIAINSVRSFDNLMKHEQKRLRTIAEHSPHLPVLLSRNPQDIMAAKERMQSLKVGSKAFLPTRAGQRTDRRNHWTQLAICAFDACMENSQRVPQFEAHYSNAKCRRVKRELWGITETGTEYALPNGSQVVIADWQKECAKLTAPITADNLDQWRSVIKMCLLAFWKDSNENYKKALKEVGNPTTPESYRCNPDSYRRHLAINRTLQAFKNHFRPVD
jgi:hypothetical protein